MTLNLQTNRRLAPAEDFTFLQNIGSCRGGGGGGEGGMVGVDIH